MTYPTGEAAVYTYDANHNMLSSGVEGETHTTTYEYNAQNQVTKVNNIDGSVVRKTYDDAGRLNKLTDMTRKENSLSQLDDILGSTSAISKGVKALPYISIVVDTGNGIIENINDGTSPERIASDAVVDVGFGLAGIGASALGGLAAGSLAGSAVPIVGNIAGAVGGTIGGIAFYVASEVIEINRKSPVEWAKEGAGWLADKIKSWWD